MATFDDDWNTSQTAEAPASTPPPSDNSYTLPDSPSGNWSGVVRDSAIAHNVPVGLQFNLTNHESSGNPEAQNPHSSAYGLGQQTDANWADYERRKGSKVDRKDPMNQADATADNLNTYYQQFGTWRMASMAYYAGAGLMDKVNKGLPLSPKEQQRVIEAGQYADAVKAGDFDTQDKKQPESAPESSSEPSSEPQAQSDTSGFDDEYRATQGPTDALQGTTNTFATDVYNITRPDYDINNAPQEAPVSKLALTPEQQLQVKTRDKPWLPQIGLDSALEGPRAAITGTYDLLAGIQNQGLSTDAWVSGLFGGNPSYIPIPKLEERTDKISQALVPESKSGMFVAEALPFFLSDGLGELSKAGEVENLLNLSKLSDVPLIPRQIISNTLPSMSGTHTGEEFKDNLVANTAVGTGAGLAVAPVRSAYRAITRKNDLFSHIQNQLDQLAADTADARAAHARAEEAQFGAKHSAFEADYRAKQAQAKSNAAGEAEFGAQWAEDTAAEENMKARWAAEEAEHNWEQHQEAQNTDEPFYDQETVDLMNRRAEAQQAERESAEKAAYATEAANQARADSELAFGNAENAKGRATEAHDTYLAKQAAYDEARQRLAMTETGTGMSQQQLIDARKTVKEFIDDNTPFKAEAGDSRFIRGLKAIGNGIGGSRHGVAEIQSILGKENVLFRPQSEGGYGLHASDLEKAAPLLDRMGAKRYYSYFTGLTGLLHHGIQDVKTIKELISIAKDPQIFAHAADEESKQIIRTAFDHVKRGDLQSARKALEQPEWSPEMRPYIDKVKRVIRVAESHGKPGQNAYGRMAVGLALGIGAEYVGDEAMDALGMPQWVKYTAQGVGLAIQIMYHRAAHKQLKSLDKVLSERYEPNQDQRILKYTNKALKPVKLTLSQGMRAKSQEDRQDERDIKLTEAQQNEEWMNAFR